MTGESIDLVDILNWAQSLSPILGFITYFFAIENVPKQNHLLFAYLVICFFADTISYFRFIPTQLIFNLRDILQFLVLVAIYNILFKQRGAFFLITTIIIYLIGLTITLTHQGINTSHNHMWALSGFLISLMALVYVNAVNVWPKELIADGNLYNTLVMNTSFLFYFLTTFLFFFLAARMVKEMSAEELRITWSFHNGIGLVKNVGLAVAIFLTGKHKVENATVRGTPIYTPANYQPKSTDPNQAFRRRGLF